MVRLLWENSHRRSGFDGRDHREEFQVGNFEGGQA